MAGLIAWPGAWKLLVAVGGPIPMTPGVLTGRDRRLAFLGVGLVHAWVEGILICYGLRPLTSLLRDAAEASSP